MNEKIKILAELMEKEALEELIRSKVDCQTNRDLCKSKIIEGTKYTKIDIMGSGKLMIDNQGNIYGIKAYGVIHKGYFYGTLDTINDYYWGTYYPQKKLIKAA